MANSAKRQTYKLADDSQDYNRNVQVSMTTDADGENLRVTFFTRPEAFTEKTGTKDQVRDALEKVIEARLDKKGIATQHRVADGYIVFSTSDKAAKSTQALYTEAEAAIKTIAAYTSKGVELKSALNQALEAEKSGASSVEVKTALGKEEAAAAILFKGIERIMPKAEASKLAATLGNRIATQFPTRPSVPNASKGSDSSPLNDPLYKAVNEAVTENVIPDAGKRHYAVGEITDALQAAYNNLGAAVQAPARKRA